MPAISKIPLVILFPERMQMSAVSSVCPAYSPILRSKEPKLRNYALGTDFGAQRMSVNFYFYLVGFRFQVFAQS